MPHVFDTGETKPTPALIRDALIARLAQLRKAAGLYVVKLATVPRMMKGDGDDEALFHIEHALQGQAPALFIAIGDSRPFEVGLEPIDGMEFIDFAIYACSRHAGSSTEGRLYGDGLSSGDVTADPGVFTMLAHARERIHGQKLIDIANEPRWTGQSEVVTSEDVTIWEQRYSIRASLVINPDRAVTQALVSVEAKHDLDGTADADDGNPIVTTVTEIDP